VPREYKIPYSFSMDTFRKLCFNLSPRRVEVLSLGLLGYEGNDDKKILLWESAVKVKIGGNWTISKS
jgi:hypothetical protein